jgi:hypothetical protein
VSVAATVLAIFALASGVVWIRSAMLEAGTYSSPHGFTLDGKAYRAVQEAQQLQPGTHLRVATRRAMVGPDWHYEVTLAKDYDDRGFVKLETRGVPLEVTRYLYDRRMLSPTISHDGRADKSTGYTFRFRKG